MRSVALHLVLAVAGLLAAYQTWTRGDDEQLPPPGEATVVQCEPGELRSFAMKGKTRNVMVEPRKLDGEDAYWITVQNITLKPKPKPERPAPEAEQKPGEKKPEEKGAAGKEPAGEGDKAPADKTADKDAQPESEKKITTKAFLGNPAFDEYMKWIAPLRAVRSLGSVDKDQLKSFGLEKDAIETTLEIECGKQKKKIEVGAWTYGRGDRYARLAGESQVYLIPAAVVRDLLSAGFKFMRKKLHDFEPGEVDEARVRALDTQRKLLHRDRQVKDSAMWVNASAPDQRNRLFDNWFRQVGKLQAFVYLAPGEQPGSDLEQQSGQVEQLLSIEYLQAGKPLGKMQLVRVIADKEYYYAHSEKTHVWVRVARSLASQVARDAAMVVGKEEPPEQPEPATASKPAAGGNP